METKVNLSQPYEERLRNYLAVRNKIFRDRQLEGKRGISVRIEKARVRYGRRRETRAQVVEAVTRRGSKYPRAFAEL